MSQQNQKKRLQDSLKSSLNHQLEMKNYQKDNAFRMTKREKNINRTDLHLWKDGKAEHDSHIPGWGYNSRYKYLGMHNSFKKNVGSLDFPLGGDLHRSVQVRANHHLGRIENSINQNGDKAFVNTGNFVMGDDNPTKRGGLGVGGVNRQRTPGGTRNIMGNNASLYASEPNLRARLRESGEMITQPNAPGPQTEADAGGKTEVPEGYGQSHMKTENLMSRDFGGQLGPLC